VHILLVALWLGTDFGTFVSFGRMRNPRLSIETRREMLRLSDFLDMGPRTALVAMLTLGVTLTYLGGWGFTGPGGAYLSVGAAVLAVLWLAGVWHQYWVTHPGEGEVRSPGHVRFQQGFRRVDLVLRLVVTSLLLLAAVLSLAGVGPIDANWLSVKLILFAVIVALGVGLRLLLPAIGSRVTDIFANGSTPEREAALTPVARRAEVMVLGIWACIAVITWLAVAKP
jgi:hypothetical protein